jgi:hypothetical protein
MEYMFALFMEGYACCQPGQFEMYKIWQHINLLCQKSSSSCSLVASNDLKGSYSSAGNASTYGLVRSSLSGRGRSLPIRQHFKYWFRDCSLPFPVCTEDKTAEAWGCPFSSLYRWETSRLESPQSGTRCIEFNNEFSHTEIALHSHHCYAKILFLLVLMGHNDTDVLVTLSFPVPDVRSSIIDQDTGFPDRDLSSSAQSVQTSVEMIPRLGHDCFLPNPLQFIIHMSSYHWTLHGLGTESVVTERKEINHTVENWYCLSVHMNLLYWKT